MSSKSNKQIIDSDKRNSLDNTTIRQTEEFCLSLVESTSDSMYLVDGHYRYLFINSQHLSRMGMPSADIIGRSYEEFHSPEQTEIFVEKVKQVFKTGTSVQQEHHSSRDGRYFLRTFSPIKEADPNGEIIIVAVVSKDITDRKLMEEALLESEARYRNILENIVDVYYRTDKDGNLIMLSPSGAAMSGYNSIDELIGKSISDYFYFNAEDRGRLLSILREQGSVKDFEVILKHKDGTPITVSTSSRYYYDEGRDVLGVEGIFRDITERKRVEGALRESEERYRYLVKYAPTGIFEIDFTSRKFLSVNDAMCQYTDYTREEFLLSIGPMQLLTEESQKSFMQRHAKVLAGESVPDNVEFQIQRKDGSKFWALLNVHYSYEPNNRIIATVIAHDITERKKAETEVRRAYEQLRAADEQMRAQYNSLVESERALRESEGKYRLITERMSDIIWTLDSNFRVQYVSPSVSKALGFTPEERMQQALFERITPESLKKVKKVLELETQRDRGNGVDPDRTVTLELEYYHKNGSTVWHETVVSSIRDVEGNFIGFHGVSRDITERKNIEKERKILEERLQRAEKMEALGTLAGGVAHDLNNVLGVVIGYSELLLMDADKSRSISPSIVNIMNGAKRAAAIVQDLLTLARRGVPGREILNLNKIIADCQQSPEFEKLLSYHSSARIKTDLEPDLPNISGSSVHLGKTFFNLVSNASEAMPKGGILTIKTANQYLDKPIQGYDEVREGDYVVLSVSDTGEGIPAADLKRIFEPFYTKKIMGRSGTGLGLAVVWGTVKDHNGYINVESEEGKGSIFTLYFPVTREDIPAEAATISISEYTGKGESILIVDDVKEQRDLATGMLRKLNYNVSCVSSGEEAIAYLKEQKIDLMVLDMIMDPGMDGLDTYRSALKIHPKQKAIIVSGFSETDRVRTAQALGAGAYVRKPYVIEKLGLAVKKELDRK